MTIQWMTTAPNPRSYHGGYDGGNTGWKLHAVEAEASETFVDVKRRVAACGLRVTLYPTDPKVITK